MSSRRLGRQYAFVILHSVDSKKVAIENVVDDFWESGLFEEELNAEEQPLIPRMPQNTEQEFCKKLVVGTYNLKDEIDALLKETSTHWDLDRMAVVDRNVLRLGIYELLYEDDIPMKVSINEAIELAKRYGENSTLPHMKQLKFSHQFVNGILDKIAQKYPKDGEKPAKVTPSTQSKKSSSQPSGLKSTGKTGKTGKTMVRRKSQ